MKRKKNKSIMLLLSLLLSLINSSESKKINVEPLQKPLMTKVGICSEDLDNVLCNKSGRVENIILDSYGYKVAVNTGDGLFYYSDLCKANIGIGDYVEKGDIIGQKAHLVDSAEVINPKNSEQYVQFSDRITLACEAQATSNTTGKTIWIQVFQDDCTGLLREARIGGFAQTSLVINYEYKYGQNGINMVSRSSQIGWHDRSFIDPWEEIYAYVEVILGTKDFLMDKYVSSSADTLVLNNYGDGIYGSSYQIIGSDYEVYTHRIISSSSGGYISEWYNGESLLSARTGSYSHSIHEIDTPSLDSFGNITARTVSLYFDGNECVSVNKAADGHTISRTQIERSCPQNDSIINVTTINYDKSYVTKTTSTENHNYMKSIFFAEFGYAAILNNASNLEVLEIRDTNENILCIQRFAPAIQLSDETLNVSVTDSGVIISIWVDKTGEQIDVTIDSKGRISTTVRDLNGNILPYGIDPEQKLYLSTTRGDMIFVPIGSLR